MSSSTAFYVLNQTVGFADVDPIAKRTGLKPWDILHRLEEMHKSNLHEDLKWVANQLLEDNQVVVLEDNGSV